ncbi:hypothetical protein [Candidatus Lucifugimonas marina]|uniref:Uncharacterized protein n=1 Tax=Candidatus Lucifugimonas marina TaxID=3038979 RepID=A0AAJ6CRI6_9CHLR|nr:hypothetical protein [SAR202 cluster bacterium JH702]MDG0868681.1 hypothetical protein [SAR202 cluster bacterium JH639]WFG35312.1 hypothetical protein GKN94_06270 [SAR202 cluster bacterium JH545]WFG39261.1 hypothetical protein GKO48_06395 [SAR202 cluster bacterium JH1073]
MAKLGDFEFPEIGLVESIELGKKIAREFAGEVSRQGLARSLGMSERGGAFSARLGALRMWGVAGGRSRVRVTRDGLRAVTPLSANESEDARIQLSRNVALFVEMSKRLGDEPYAQDRFAVLLEELSGADRSEVARRLALIDRVFSEARPYLPKDGADGFSESIGQPTDGTTVTSTSIPSSENDYLGNAPIHSSGVPNESVRSAAEPQNPAHATPAGDRIELGLPDGKLSLPETLANLDAALTVLWARRQLVAAIDAAEGKATPQPPRDFSGQSARR